MEADHVAAELSKHTAICEERWKTVFHELEDLKSQIQRIETIMIGVAGTMIIGGCGVLWTILTMHS
tara:strand:+ start:389 stop:586 length:198 start_codon:yes stop_codon:yes gene_type:complete